MINRNESRMLAKEQANRIHRLRTGAAAPAPGTDEQRAVNPHRTMRQPRR
ncbi:MAG: hypothetical protein AAF918_10520 [Pseudomonadota bacterium]